MNFLPGFLSSPGTWVVVVVVGGQHAYIVRRIYIALSSYMYVTLCSVMLVTARSLEKGVTK